MLTTPQEYLDTLDGPGRDWLAEFLEHMEKTHSDIKPVMFRQRPMFKVGKSYVFFTVAREHFSIHTLNFDLIEALKASLPKAGYGKGCIKVKFFDGHAKPLLKELCDEVVRLNLRTDAPKIDAVSERPYELKLNKAFSGGKLKWMPLYEKLKDMVKERLPEFTEYFPAVNVLWKHTSTFAQISAVSGAMRIEFYSDIFHPEYKPIKTLQTSKNRVAHTVEIMDESGLDEILHWIAESYALTIR